MSETATAKIERSIVSTGLTYPALVTAFEGALGRWDPETATRLVKRQVSWSEVEREVDRATGPTGLVIIARVDQGALLSLSGSVKQCSLYLVGNPVIAERILSFDIRASLYVPFRVCLYDDGNANGASIAYDRPSSFLRALERPELIAIGTLLDRKIDDVVAAIQQHQPAAR
jgi:uncharacterized protein (DUF302 family)